MKTSITHALYTLRMERIELSGEIKRQDGYLESYKDAKGYVNKSFIKMKRNYIRKLKRKHDQISEAMRILNQNK